MVGQRHGFVLEMTWVLDAPRELVFQALSDLAALGQWWGPPGFTTRVIELDLKVAGRYRFGMRPPDGDVFHLAGEFIEIDPPRRLAYSFRWEEPTSDDQADRGDVDPGRPPDGTRFTLSQGEFASQDRLALHKSGWTDSLAKLRRFLETRT